MSKPVTISQAASRLKNADRILILIHQYPDGDTIGCGYALYHALTSLGKQARVECENVIPAKYAYMMENVAFSNFAPQFICAVDVADVKLLGPHMQKYAEMVDLCIDHHGTNVEYASELLCDPKSAATAELMVKVLEELGTTMNREIAECLYTGIATDTGCFKYPNTTPTTHRIAAGLMEYDVRMEMINRSMFDLKSRARLQLEQRAMNSIRFFFDGRCAVMQITNEMVRLSGAGEDDLEGLTPLSRQIEGVWVGVTMRQKEDGSYKVSLRTGTHADAAAICSKLGGGGHVRAAGCAPSGTPEEVLEKVLAAISETVPRIQEGSAC